MREIKFRAWDKEEKRWYQNAPVIQQLHTDHTWTLYSHLETVELMQYTGLKDKNGKEIYEGDILKYTRLGWRCFGHSKDNTDLVTYYEIKWSDVNCAFRTENKSMSGSLIFDDGRAKKNEIEIIGNIYENKELLEEVYNATG